MRSRSAIQADFLSKSENYHEIKTFVQKIGTNPRVRNKSAVFDFCPPSHFAAKRRGILRSAAASRPRGAILSNREVSIGGEGGIPAHPSLAACPCTWLATPSQPAGLAATSSCRVSTRLRIPLHISHWPVLPTKSGLYWSNGEIVSFARTFFERKPD